MSLPELQSLAEAALPLFMVGAAVGAGAIGYLIARIQARLMRHTIARLSRSVESLEGQLTEAEEVIRRVTDGTDDILRAARGAQHRTQEEAPRD